MDELIVIEQDLKKTTKKVASLTSKYQKEKEQLIKVLCTTCRTKARHKLCFVQSESQETNKSLTEENREIIDILTQRFKEYESLQSRGQLDTLASPLAQNVGSSMQRPRESYNQPRSGGDRWIPNLMLRRTSSDIHRPGAAPPEQNIIDLKQKIEDLSGEIQKIKEENQNILSKNDTLERQLNDEQNSRKKLENDIQLEKEQSQQQHTDLMDKISKHQISMSELLQENTALKMELHDQREECNELRRQVSDKNDSIEKATDFLQKENESLHRKVHKLNSEIEEVIEKNTTLSSHLSDYKKERNELKLQIEHLQEEINRAIHEQSKKDSENELLRGEIEKVQRDNEEWQFKLGKKESENDYLKEDLQNLQEEKKQVIHEQSKKDSENELLRGKIEIVQWENEKRQLKLGEKESENEYLKEELNRRVEEITRLQKQLVKTIPPLVRKCRSYLSEVMGIRSIGSGLTHSDSSMIVREFSRLLKNKFKREHVDLIVKPCSTVLEVSNGPLVVLCLSQTRIGANVKDAMEGIKGSGDVVILVLHHIKEDAVSSIYPTKHQIGTDYPEIGGILDMAYLEDRGIYDCDFNAETLHDLIGLLMRYVNKK